VLKNKKPYEWVKRLIKTALVFIAIALLVFAFIPEKVKVDLISVEKGDLTVSVEGEGKTRIHDIYTIYTPMEGRVTRIESNAGDSITAGKTIIANMYPANPAFLDKRSQIQAKANINGAESAPELASSRVRQAQAQLTFDQSEYKRAQELFNSNMISTAALERAETQLTMQKAKRTHL
jgi:HlyD family secretion protein